MCGILFVSRRDGKSAAKQALKRYRKQKARGSEGFGVVAFDAKIKTYKRFMHEEQMVDNVQALTAKNILLHHRYPTSVLNLPETAHPIRVMHEELDNVYYVAHNGHITNHEELKRQHEKLGYAYTTEVETQYLTRKKKRWFGASEYNDSEALAIELARTIEGKQASVGAKGAIAYMVLQVKDKQPIALYYGTNGGNPLTMKRDDTFIAIASEGYTPIADEQGYRLDLATHEVREVTIPLPAVYKYKPHDYSAYDERPYSYPKTGTMGFLKSDVSTEDYMNAYDIERELEDVGEELIQCALALNTAVETGNEEDAQAWQDEYNQLDAQRKRLERQLETSVLRGL